MNRVDTKWEKISREHIDEDLLREAGEIIRRGGLVAFPTETVYGLGGDALNPESSRKIYSAKGSRFAGFGQNCFPYTKSGRSLGKAFLAGASYHDFFKK